MPGEVRIDSRPHDEHPLAFFGVGKGIVCVLLWAVGLFVLALDGCTMIHPIFRLVACYASLDSLCEILFVFCRDLVLDVDGGIISIDPVSGESNRVVVPCVVAFVLFLWQLFVLWDIWSGGVCRVWLCICIVVVVLVIVP